MLIAADYDEVVGQTVTNWKNHDISAYDTCPGAKLYEDLLDAQKLGFLDQDQSEQIEKALDEIMDQMDDDGSLTSDTVDATSELIDRIIGDYEGEIEGG